MGPVQLTQPLTLIRTTYYTFNKINIISLVNKYSLGFSESLEDITWCLKEVRV